MTNEVFNKLKEDAYQICVLGNDDNRLMDELWQIVQDFETERIHNKEMSIQRINEKRKTDPNYARTMENGKQKRYDKKKEVADDKTS